jgi:hypothetical protein
VYAQTNAYHPLVNATVLAAANTSWLGAGGCRDQIVACNAANGTDAICSRAQSYCNNRVLGPLSGPVRSLLPLWSDAANASPAQYDDYDVRSLDPDP